MAGSLICAGFTGSLMAFYPELEEAMNPQYYPTSQAGKPLDLATLIEREKCLAPEGEVEGVWLQSFMDNTVVWVIPKDPDRPLTFNQLIFDPVTGQELGRRQFGALSDGLGNLMSFIYDFHYSLSLNMYGMWAMGICALSGRECDTGQRVNFLSQNHERPFHRHRGNGQAISLM